MAKIDLADGYYRIPISPQASLSLAVVLPNDNMSEPLIGLQLSLPMGWKHSPPYFCAFTETCADMANAIPLPTFDHPFQYALSSQPTAPQATARFPPTTIWPFNPQPTPQPLQYTEVYLDDFMLLAHKPHHIQTLNNLLQHLSTVFHDPADSPRQSSVQRKGF